MLRGHGRPGSTYLYSNRTPKFKSVLIGNREEKTLKVYNFVPKASALAMLEYYGQLNGAKFKKQISLTFNKIVIKVKTDFNQAQRNQFTFNRFSLKVNTLRSSGGGGGGGCCARLTGIKIETVHGN